MKYIEPYIIEFAKIGASGVGYISVAENLKSIPFKVERIFWTYFTPEELTRGHHAHFKTQQVLIAAAGKINIHTEMPTGEKKVFVLEKPHLGLFLPPHVWHYMEYSHTAVQMVFSDMPYDEKDYIRDYNKYKEIYKV